MPSWRTLLRFRHLSLIETPSPDTFTSQTAIPETPNIAAAADEQGMDLLHNGLFRLSR